MSHANCSARDYQPIGRPMRWYQWLLILMLFGIASGVRAESVYKCKGAHGSVAYQSQACSSDQQADVVELDPMPAYVPSPKYAVEHDAHRSAERAPREPRSERRETIDTSYECRTSDGQVFYRHSGCPHSVVAKDPNAQPSSKGRAKSNIEQKVTVSSRRVPREEACHAIHAAGAGGRSGRANDEDVSTYDRNLGHDPCR